MVRSRTQRASGGRAGEGRPNELLAALPRVDRDRMQLRLTEVSHTVRQIVYDIDTEIEHVYFPLSGVISIVSVMSDGAAVEVATIGNEGMVGLPLALGARKATQQAFTQVPGRALRMDAEAFLDELARRGALSDLIGRYTQALFTQVAQSSACNRMHSVEERCARWLLLTHDRMTGDTFELTHLFLAQMLGVRRATVSEVAARLQKKGLLRYARGKMTVLDRAGLERASCECYALIRREFDRLLRDGGPVMELSEVKRRASRGGESTTRAPLPRRNRWEPES